MVLLFLLYSNIMDALTNGFLTLLFSSKAKASLVKYRVYVEDDSPFFFVVGTFVSISVLFYRQKTSNLRLTLVFPSTSIISLLL